MTHHRIAHELYNLGVPVIPRIISEMAHSATGIDIHPGATIDEEFFIDHGTGVVIGETAVIGKGCRLYQGVTLGALSFPKDGDGVLVKGVPRHPILEDNVTVYAGATILGRITIGSGSIIGGNVWVTKDVPARDEARTEAFRPAHRRVAYGQGIAMRALLLCACLLALLLAGLRSSTVRAKGQWKAAYRRADRFNL